MRVLPLGQTRGAKYGRCRLCGQTGTLSDTHVPPRKAGNCGDARPAVQRIDPNGASTVGLGRPKQGGMSGYWFCVDCNRRTGKWDEIYIGLHRELLKLLHFGPELPRERMMGRLNIDIGAFARAMWAWSFALVPTLRDDYPHVAEAVRTGASVDPPVGIDLLLGVTMSLHIWAVGQPAAVKASISAAGAVKRPSGLVVPGTQMEPLPITVVSSPPFNVVLAHAERPRGVPHSVVSGWLHDPAGVRRDVEVDLPMVDIAGDSTVGPMVVDYSILARAPSPGSDGR